MLQTHFPHVKPQHTTEDIPEDAHHGSEKNAIVWNAFPYLCLWRSIAANWKISSENWECFFCEADGHFQSGRRPHLYACTFPRIKSTVSGPLFRYSKVC